MVADFLPTFDLHDAREALAALTDTEVLILGGAQDNMTPPEHSDELALLLPQAEHVVVEDAGHLVMLEHPEVVDQALFALIERGQRPGRVRAAIAWSAGAARSSGLAARSAAPSPDGRRHDRRRAVTDAGLPSSRGTLPCRTPRTWSTLGRRLGRRAACRRPAWC